MLEASQIASLSSIMLNSKVAHVCISLAVRLMGIARFTMAATTLVA